MAKKIDDRFSRLAFHVSVCLTPLSSPPAALLVPLPLNQRRLQLNSATAASDTAGAAAASPTLPSSPLAALRCLAAAETPALMAAPPAPRPPPAHSPDTQFRMSATQSAAPRGRHRHQKHAPRLHMPRRTPPASCYQRLRSSQLQPFLRCCASPDMGLYRLPLASTPHCPPDLRHAAPRHRSRPRRRDVTWGDILPGDIYLVSPGRLAGRRPPPTPKRVSRGGRTAQPCSNTLASPTAFPLPCTVTLSYYYYITVLRARRRAHNRRGRRATRRRE